MMKNIFIALGLVSWMFLIAGCADEKQDEDKGEKSVSLVKSKSKSDQNLNISFLLDLSDRINPEKYPNKSMEYYERDVAYIRSVSQAFDTHLRNKRVRQMDERIQVFFDPEPRNQNINTISNGLRFDVGRENASMALLDEIRNIYSTAPKKIYDLAIADDTYIGSDTWRFFKSKVKDFCLEENHRNILVILTDGYIYHKNTIMEQGNRATYLTPQTIRSMKLNSMNWKDRIIEKEYGFLKATDDLSDLEILVLGINPDTKNPYEEDIILHYWAEWFDTMKVHKYEIKTAELPSNMDNIIKEFILN